MEYSIHDVHSEILYYYDEELQKTLQSVKDRKIRQYVRINPRKAKTLWKQFMTLGFVRDENILNEIAEIILRNTVRLQINTALSGHESVRPEDIVEYAGFDFDESDWQWMGDNLTWDKKTKNDFISDYGVAPLIKICHDILKSKKAEERIVNCDRALNVIHQRGSLAELFIIGGRKSLDEISQDVEITVTERKHIKYFTEFITEKKFSKADKEILARFFANNDIQLLYRGISLDEALKSAKAGHLVYYSKDPMSLDWEVIEYALGDSVSEMSEEEINKFVNNTVYWRPINKGVNLTSDLDNAKGYSQIVAEVDCTGECAEFDDTHYFAKEPKDCKIKKFYYNGYEYTCEEFLKKFNKK